MDGVSLISRAEPMGQDWTDHLAALPAPAPAGDLGEPFDAFFRREHPRLVALAVAVGGAHRGEDIAQEALLRAHREWDRIARYDKPGAWARRVTINLAMSSRRRDGSERRALRRLAARPAPDVPAPELDGFWDLVRALPPRQAAAIALRYLDDLPVAEIAAVLDCAEGTAKAHLHQARASLARHLGLDAEAPAPAPAAAGSPPDPAALSTDLPEETP